VLDILAHKRRGHTAVEAFLRRVLASCEGAVPRVVVTDLGRVGQSCSLRLGDVGLPGEHARLLAPEPDVAQRSRDGQVLGQV